MVGGVKFWHPLKYDVFEIYCFPYSDLGGKNAAHVMPLKSVKYVTFLQFGGKRKGGNYANFLH